MSSTTRAQAIAAIKAGKRNEGRAMLEQILADDPDNINALLWMTEVVDTPSQKREYLNRVLAIEPNNPNARRGLEILGPEPLQPVQSPPLSKQEPITEHFPVDRPLPEDKPVVTQPPIPTKQTIGKTKSRSALGIALLLIVIVAGAVVVNNEIQTRAYLDRKSRECDGVLAWERASSDRLDERKQIAKQISQATKSGSAIKIARTARAASDNMANLEWEQKSSQPPVVASELNSKFVQAFHMYSVGWQMLAEGVETDSDSTQKSGMSMAQQGEDLLLGSDVLLGSVIRQCK